MASKKENIKALFSNTRSRVIVLLTIFMMLITILVGYFKFRTPPLENLSNASVSGGPGRISSIPGAINPTAQYASLQEKQNVNQAEKAVKTGASAIPTIVRSQAFGAGIQAVGPQGGKGALGFSALSREDLSGPQQSLWLQQLKDSNCSKSAVALVLSQGAGLSDLKPACTCAQLKDNGYPLNELQTVCSCTDLKAAGFNVTQLKASGMSAERLKSCGANACEMRAAGFTAKDLKQAGYSDGELKGAGYPEAEIAHAVVLPKGVSEADIKKAGCQVAALKRLREEGVSAETIRRLNGCSAAQLKAAGYTAKELKDAGYPVNELKNAGYPESETRGTDGLPPGVTEADVRKAGCSIEGLEKLRAEGVSAAAIHRINGCSAAQLRAAGYTAQELKDAGLTSQKTGDSQKTGGADLNSGKSELAGLDETTPVSGIQPEATIPSLLGKSSAQATQAAQNEKNLRDILNRQKIHMAEQQYQQKIQQKTTQMTGAANQVLQGWKVGFTQAYVGGSNKENEDMGAEQGGTGTVGKYARISGGNGKQMPNTPPVIHAGEVIFAVLDTSVNSDQPGPILATIVSGRFNGAKLIGSFTKPDNADKMVISFNMMSVPGAVKTTPINAYAIDPNTARTALASKVDHHYLLRYGGLFASTFLEGFGNAFQSAGTTVTIGGTGGVSTTTVSNGVGRSVLENAVIGLATVGKNWGQVAMRQVDTPVTVDVYSGTGIGILFTQDVATV